MFVQDTYKNTFRHDKEGNSIGLTERSGKPKLNKYGKPIMKQVGKPIKNTKEQWDKSQVLWKKGQFKIVRQQVFGKTSYETKKLN